MNVIGMQDHPVSPDVWDEPEMRQVVAARDISSVYRLLRRVGISQRQIAALTGQSQSEVSEILKGRQVMAYDVLARICDGLGIPRGYMGLAYDEATATSVVGPPGDELAEEDESVKRRKFLAHAATVTMGGALGTDPGDWLSSLAQTPAPGRIGMTDVKQVEASTRALRALDYQFGGGACRDAVVAQLSWAQRMIPATGSEVVRKSLFRALADLQNLAGWTTFDVGMLDDARNHFATALKFGRESGDHGLMSNILFRMGRVYLHYEAPNDALKLFQLGQIAAQDSGSELAVAVLCANEAWAFAMMNEPDQTMKQLGRARDEFARADLSEAPDWVRTFDSNDLYAMIGTVHTELGRTQPKYVSIAIPALVQALNGWGQTMTRSRAFNMTALATNHLRQGDVDHGSAVGRNAIELATGLKSARMVDRLKPLEVEAVKRANHGEARELTQLIRQYRAS